jgi:hypothetical protein
MNIAIAVATLAAALAGSGFAADRLEVQGATSAHYMLKPYAERILAASDVQFAVTPVGTATAMLDLIEGRAQAAIVTVPLMDAVASARVMAWSEHRKLLMVQPGLTYHAVATVDPNGRPLAFVTMGAPSPELARVIRYFDERMTNRTALNP